VNARVCQFQFLELLGDDAGDGAAGFQNGIGEYAHEADAAAAEQHTDVSFGKRTAQHDGLLRKNGIIAWVGSAKNGYGMHVTWCLTLLCNGVLSTF
jgi:hypothetical protein